MLISMPYGPHRLDDQPLGSPGNHNVPQPVLGDERMTEADEQTNGLTFQGPAYMPM